MSDTYYVNGQFIASEQAALPVTDLGLLRGYGVFDYFRTYHREPFRLMDNLVRLRRSADIIGLTLPWSDAELAQIVRETLDRNAHHDESAVRIVVTGGSSQDNINPAAAPSLMVLVSAVKPNPDWWYSDGVKVITIQIGRLFPDAKSTNYIPAILALREARAAGAIEALYLSPDDEVLEATTSNLFIVRDGTLITPPVDGILSGLTRRTVLEITAAHYPRSEQTISRDDLINADEVFMTSANKRVVPVTQVDDVRIGSGTPGPVTQQVIALFDEVTWGVREAR